MVDDYGQMESTPESVASVPSEADVAPAGDGSKRLLVIIAAVVALLVVAGLVAVAVFVFVLGSAVDELAPPPVIETPGASAPSAEGQPVEPPPVGLNRIFTFRDIFDPLLVPLPPEPEPSTPTPTAPDGTPLPDPDDPDGDPGVTLPPDTLFLRDVVSTDGVTSAVLYLNGQTYTLAPGDAISGTPWQVLSISGRSVVMLYGDVQVTLSIGQGVVSSVK